MTDDTTITPFHQPGSIIDPLTDERLPDGRQRVVRHGTGPERTIQTGIGPIPVRRRKLRDRATGAPAEQKTCFTSNNLPRWARRTRSLDALLPVLYLRRVSTGGFQVTVGGRGQGAYFARGTECD